jgi:hypothetical protein
MGVKRHHSRAVRDADESYAFALQSPIQRGLVGIIECTDGFIEDDKARKVHQQTRKGQALLRTHA